MFFVWTINSLNVGGNTFENNTSFGRFWTSMWDAMKGNPHLTVRDMPFLQKHTHTHTHIYIYIVLSSTDRPVSFYQNSSGWLDRLDSRSWDRNPVDLKSQSQILSLSHEKTSASEGNLNAYVSHLFLFTYIRLTATESSIHMKSLAIP